MAREKDLEAALQLLERHSDFRVLRRLLPVQEVNADIGSDVVTGVVVDVETTGLDSEIDEVIELGMIKFVFNKDGAIGRVTNTYKSFNQPERPIPAPITQLTGIQNSDVAGHSISEEEVASFLDGVGLVIAHNAVFDRPFCEKVASVFDDLPWACTATQINWRSEGIVGTRLEYIACSFGCFYDAHRAVDDCNAVLSILSHDLPRSKQSVFSQLLHAARQIDTRIFAEGAAYEARVALKRLGYRWNDGENGLPRAWWKDVPMDQVDQELSSLRTLPGNANVEPTYMRMNARNRFKRNI